MTLPFLLSAALAARGPSGSPGVDAGDVPDDSLADVEPEGDAVGEADAGDESAGTDADGEEFECPGCPLPAPGPGFHTVGGAILDEWGRTVTLHAINVANSAKYSADLLPWQGEEDFVALAALGFDAVRLLTFWSAVMPEEGVIGEAYLDAYARRVRRAADAGLLVVIDMHQDLFGVGFGEDGAPRWACDEALYASYAPRTPLWTGDPWAPPPPVTAVVTRTADGSAVPCAPTDPRVEGLLVCPPEGLPGPSIADGALYDVDIGHRSMP